VLNCFRTDRKRGIHQEFERIALNGFIYVTAKCKKGKDAPRYWRCSNRRCRGSAKTDAAILHGEAGSSHSHPPDDALVGKAIAECKLYDIARQRPDLRPAQIVDAILSELPPEVQAVMPSRSTLLFRAMRRKRKPEQSGKYANVVRRRVRSPYDDEEYEET